LFTIPTELIPKLNELGYVLNEELATVLFLMLKLNKPLLIEGNPGVGKTEVANVLAALFKTNLIRLQCYEGLDVHSAVYEWNYQKQLLAIKIQEQSNLSIQQKEDLIFSEDYLLKRPLLQAITATQKQVLLIDEIDRSDEEFEAFLLELLSVYQISIPEMGTIKAKSQPIVLLTSNRTRALSDALKRRCLYYWLPYPDKEKELDIIYKHLPNIEKTLAQQIVDIVARLRQLKLDKVPGIAETIDWANGLLSLGIKTITQENIKPSLACILKSTEDVGLVKNELSSIIE